MYPTFVETLEAIKPIYWFRLIGGSLYLVGMVLMTYNLVRTGLARKAVETSVDVVALAPAPEVPWRDVIFSRPIVLTTIVLGLAGAGLAANAFASPLFLILAFSVALFGAIAAQAAKKGHGAGFHRILEGRALLFTVLSGLAVLAGGVAELVPALVIKPVEASDTRPYRALEVEGRDVFIAEGCYTCHSQMIRPMRFETLRYGDPSALADSAYDHPFQWGSKRTGPDLAREGGKYPNLWHYHHLKDPRAITPGSNMPPYAHFASAHLDLAHTGDKMHALSQVGVPYTDAEIKTAESDARLQGEQIAADLAKEGVTVAPDTQMVAVISYLQRLGKKSSAPPAKSGEAVSLQEKP
jgi:cytochrome c oxidase cbb3-type subunit I/II